MRSSEVGVDHRLIALYFRRQTFGDRFAVFQHRDAVAQAHHQLDVVLDQQHGLAFVLDLDQQLAQRQLFGGVHAGGRLVERQQLRIGGQRAGDFQAELIAIRQETRGALGELADADEVQQLLGALADRRFFQARGLVAEHGAEHALMGAHVAADHDVFQRRHLAEQTDVLEGAGDAGLGHFMRRGRRIRLAGQLESARVRLIQAGDDVEEGGLAGAVRPDQAVDLALHDLDADIGQRLQAAEALVDAGDIQYDLFAHHFLRQPSRRTTLRVYRCRRRAGPRAWARATGRPDGSA